MPRPKDEWDELAEEIVDALIDAGPNDEETTTVAKILRAHHGVEEPPHLSSAEYVAALERKRIARGQL
jgi:hypothetical protein